MPEKSGTENKPLTESEERAEVSGSYGLVIRPDVATRDRAEGLAREMAPEAEFHVKVPHITLYHGRLNSLPLQVVRDILPELREHRGDTLLLNSFEIYGGRFLFWDNEKTQSLRLMHEGALKLADYLDKEALSRAVEEGLKMAPDELENVRRFGHPLVGDKFTPHITLAYDSGGLSLPPKVPTVHWEMKIDDVLFAEIGKYGAVARVVELP